MGQIIALPASRGQGRVAPAGGSAEILFFMGVRYHRMTDQEFAQATAATLDLAEKQRGTGRRKAASAVRRKPN